MSNDANDAMALFERPLDDVVDEVEDQPITPAKRRNALALVGAALSFVPLVGLVLSAFGFVRSRTRGGVGRVTALVGIVLSVLFGGAETYVGTTAPIFDAGCLGASSPAARLRAIQASPGGDLTALANEMNSIHSDLATAAEEAGSAGVRAKLQSVADDVKSLGADFTMAQKSGDITPLIGDESKLQADGAAADSYCHSL